MNDSWYFMFDRFKRSFLDGNDIWWYMFQAIAGILHVSHANYQVRMYYYHHNSQWSDSQNAGFALFQLIKPTNLDIQDTACLPVVHIFQHPTSRSTTRSTYHTIVNTAKRNLSPLPAGKYGKLTKQSTWWHNQANQGHCGLEEEMVPALGALRSLRSKRSLLRSNGGKLTV
jgi:hypothetical protein